MRVLLPMVLRATIAASSVVCIAPHPAQLKFTNRVTAHACNAAIKIT